MPWLKFARAHTQELKNKQKIRANCLIEHPIIIRTM